MQKDALIAMPVGEKLRRWSTYWYWIPRTCGYCELREGLQRSLVPVEVGKYCLVYRCWKCKHLTKTTQIGGGSR
jgi:hypothetical protein